MLLPLVDALQSGHVSAAATVRAAGDRIATENPRINAVTGIDIDAALSQAARVDSLPEQHRKNLPLCGLPLLVKDLEDVAGWPTTYGSMPFRDARPATSDSPTVARLRAAGAIILGRSNTCEFAFEGYTTNRLHGPTRNPWNPDWSPGGSSGGSAAALAAGLVPLATATDGGGSARIPAALCGLLGLKPTTGLIGNDPDPAWLDLHTDALLATRSADLRLLLDVVAGQAPGDDAVGPIALQPAHPTRRLVYVPRLTGTGPLAHDLGPHLHEQVELLGRAVGVRVEHTTTASLFADAPTLPALWDSDWYSATSAEQAHLLGARKIARYADQWDPTFAAALEHGLSVELREYLDIRRRNIAARRVLDLLLESGTILVSPVMSDLGYTPDGRPPGAEMPGSTEGLAQTVLANLTGLPALSIPAGLVEPGLPCGLQLMAGRWHDHTLIDVAQAWEDSHPWPQTAPSYTPFGSELLG